MRKQEKQKKVIGPALLLFIVFVFSGLYLADVQLNDLTQEREFSKILNIRRDPATKEVAAYFIGGERALGKWEYFHYEVNASEITISVAKNRIWHVPYKKWYAAALQYYAEFF